MEIVILEYSDGKVIRVSLNAVQEKDFNKDSDTFIEMLSEIYSFRVKDINWMVTHDLDENHNLSDDIGQYFGKFLPKNQKLNNRTGKSRFENAKEVIEMLSKRMVKHEEMC